MNNFNHRPSRIPSISLIVVRCLVGLIRLPHLTSPYKGEEIISSNIVWRIFKAFGFALIIGVLLSLYACSSCSCEESGTTSISANTLQLTAPARPLKQEKAMEQQEESNPQQRIYRIDLKGERSNTPSPEEPEKEVVPTTTVSVPPGAFKDDHLTERLQDKLKDTASSSQPGLMNTEIFTSNQTLEEFSQYYQNRGYKVTKMSMPASQIIRPALRNKPEIADQVNLDEYDKIEINQIVIEGLGISAADKYIDPDTYQVVDKLFITKMGK